MAKVTCDECGGNGHISIIVVCSVCKGDGEIVLPDGTVVECPHCINGYSRVYATCPKCGGTGEVDVTAT